MRIGNEDYVAKLPDHRYSGFTLLIVPDKDLYGKYPDRFNESMTRRDLQIDAFLLLAAENGKGADAEVIFGLNMTVPVLTRHIKKCGTKVH